VDVVPTVLSLLGLQAPEGIEGADLSPMLRDGAAPPAGERRMYSESVAPTQYGGNSLHGVSTLRWKYIQTTRPELYDLAADPREERNLLAEQGALAKEMQGRLRAILAESLRGANPPEGSAAPDARTQALLQSLGYVGGAADGEVTFDSAREDPKDLIAFHEGVLAFLERAATLDGIVEADAMNERLAAERPGFYRGYLLLALRWEELGRLDEALARCDAAVRLAPGEAEVWYRRARVRRSLQDQEGAFADLNEAIRLDGRHPEAHYYRAGILQRRGETGKALEDYSAAIESNPRQPWFWCERGMLSQRLGDAAASVPDLERCLELLPPQTPQRPALEGMLQQARSL
jgi:tetratricopeptide (TPR) repeat protein